MSGLNYTQRRTPYWRFMPDVILKNYNSFTEAFPDADIAYAYKSNPHLSVCNVLSKAGSHFCVVSRGHLEELLDIGVPASKIVYSHTIKSLDEIEFAINKGVSCFACDSFQEVNKLAFLSNKADKPIEIFLRIDVDNTGSVIPLTGKFGIAPDMALSLMEYANEHGVKPIGFTFHIGSQCLNIDTWLSAIERVAEVWEPAQALYGVNFLNIGGGFTGAYENSKQLPLAEVAGTVLSAIDKHLPGVERLVVEPGRAISGTAVSLMTSVTGIAERPDGKTWLFLDAGVFNGLFETMDGLEYPITLLSAPDGTLQSDYHKYEQRQKLTRPSCDNAIHEYILAGPTCDSVDKMFSYTADREIRIGDRLLFENTGAYGYSLECDFNGYPAPAVEVIPSQLVSIHPNAQIIHNQEPVLASEPC